MQNPVLHVVAGAALGAVLVYALGTGVYSVEAIGNGHGFVQVNSQSGAMRLCVMERLDGDDPQRGPGIEAFRVGCTPWHQRAN